MWYLRALFTKPYKTKIEFFKKSVYLLGKNKSDMKHSLYHDYAGALLEVQQLDLALKNINIALETESKCAGAWNVKGKILLKLGNITEALGCIETGLNLNKKNAWLWISKGEALAALGNGHVEEAIACFDTGIELSPNNSLGYITKALRLLDFDKNDEALKTIDDGIKMDKKDTCMYYYKACILYEMKKPKEAIEALNKVFAIEGDLSGCPYGAKLLLEIYGVFGYTKELSQHAKDFRANDRLWNMIDNCTKAEVDNLIAWHFFKHGLDLEEALKIVTEAITLEPKEAMYHDTLGCVLQAKQQDSEALKAFEKAIKLKKSDRDITWDTLAAVYARLGRENEAKEALAKFTSLKELGKN